MYIVMISDRARKCNIKPEVTQVDSKTIKVSEAASLLGISRISAYRAVASGQIPALKIGHRLLVPLAAIEKMLMVGEL
jgi:excisionase family DNA binding protein